ncbi:signal transduction histidine kinase [Paucimonas lemoignei]|uniref:histidine kinase n=1 Tax=Paucimonas lemoignei TaxID=29443 RepID=A0A4R3I5S4_PAULE|nr:ATP-binding protein [Paucimonas lemoignei]TCS39359.1 signal transduction histidine kinase [Paucimonas lemoignei]
MRLADFILDQLDAILSEWEDFARTMKPASLTMTSKELRNHASIMLKIIAEDLRTPQTLDQQLSKSRGDGTRTTETDAGEQHGIARLESRFTIEQLVSEYRALRASVLRLWAESNKSPRVADIEDITRFNESIDHLLTASIVSFAQATRRAAELEKQRKDEFLAMLAHELRNPLSPISAAASLLKVAKNDVAMTVNASNIIARQVSHMATLIDDLLDVSRVTRGMVNLNMELFDIRRIIDAALEQIEPQVRAKRHQLTVSSISGDAIVRGDMKRLVQVFANLLGNAVKYTPEGGLIHLRLKLNKEQVLVTVEDNGIGMSPEFVPHVFDLFAQAERTSDRSAGGLGLGLALVKSLVEQHEGEVSCVSGGVGKGSQFTVCLPRQSGHENQLERRSMPREQVAAGKALKILVVDDNIDAAQSLSLLLSSSGHQVLTEHQAWPALEAARTEKPDVCILDIGLPDMDGTELARQLRAFPETAKTFLIALTGYGQPQDREDALKAGFNHHITKPVNFANLLSLLASVPSA